MTYLSPAQARKKPCPVARTFDGGKKGTCDAGDCILWRWRELNAMDHRLLSALAREQSTLLDEERAKNPDTKKTADSFHKAAVAKVMTQPSDFVFMTDEDRGYCGLGGRP